MFSLEVFVSGTTEKFSDRTWVILAGLFGGIAICIGAFVLILDEVAILVIMY